ncbi:CBM35 domain-containing protein [Halobacillus sp. Marseille-Q1614]|uniref:CBM35 domain-containing protein n=1 Tax=Halobacillus sp. Marseille-Q1614 TaxID=2709134 RepID=UPI0015715A67|nr:CBM35 domain-containing protein [Halobacillus sp. Marseille-Q1614]
MIKRSRKRKKGLVSKQGVFCVLSTFALSSVLTPAVSAQDSQFTRQGSGPMYFSTYEHQHDKNTYMPEDRYKENIDWMAENFKPYGYDMISTDGWIEGATLLNKNGYVVSHNDNWMERPLNMDGSEEEGSEGLLINGDFELGSAEGWDIETEASTGVDANDSYEGLKFYVYDPKPHTAKVSQTVEGLEDGNYTVEARVKFPNDVDNYLNGTSSANMKLTGYTDTSEGDSAPEQAVELNDGLANEYGEPRYGLFELQANVTNGQLTIEFNIDAAGEHSSFQLDNVQLYKTGEKPEEDESEEEFQYPSEKYPEGHTWEFWGDYIKEKGMDFGIYYNPLWVSPEVVKNPDKYIVKGTEDNPDGPTYVAELIDQGDPDDPTDGDRFNGGQGNERALYWVDVEHPDAEKYVKGYIDFFKEQGADFLRVDFISWYEDGMDPNLGKVGEPHGRENYETHLKWMSEAAEENNVFLSLVMPHLYEHGELERKYGDMIRINEDAFGGGWNHISERRQEWQEGWSQWANSFQGFTGFSDISGRSSMILDGDFLKLNTFEGDHAENEKKTTLSLYTLAGSPIAIADQYDTIKDNYKYYQNTELIEFNKMGLAGKPIYNSAEHYGESNDSRDSQRWVGQLPDGSWAVGLFNRQDKQQTFDFNFKEELGITEGHVRDVWTHEDLGIQSDYSVTLAPHDSVFLKVVPSQEDKVFEAETASYTYGVEFSNENEGHAGFGYLSDFNESEESVTYAVSVPKAGTYNVNLNYSAETDSEATVNVREEKSGDMTDAQKVALKATNKKWKEKGTELKLQEGTNLIRVDFTSGDFDLDSLKLEDSTDKSSGLLSNGNFNHGFEHWSRSNMVDTSIKDGSLEIAGGQDFSSDVWQYVVPKPGAYTLTADVKRNSSVDEAVLYVKNGEDTRTADISEANDMSKITISNINVSKGDVLKVGNMVSGQAGGSLTLDNVQLSPVEDHNSNVDIVDKNKNKVEIHNKRAESESPSYYVRLEEKSVPKKVHAASRKYKAVSSLDELKTKEETYFFDEETKMLWVNIPSGEQKKVQVKF